MTQLITHILCTSAEKVYYTETIKSRHKMGTKPTNC